MSGLYKWYKEKKAEYDAIKNMTPQERSRHLTKIMNQQNLCKQAVPDLKRLEKQLDKGTCDDDLEWWCEYEVAAYRDHMNKGALCPKAVKILNRILSKHTIRTVKEINEDTKNGWQVDLKF